MLVQPIGILGCDDLDAHLNTFIANEGVWACNYL